MLSYRIQKGKPTKQPTKITQNKKFQKLLMGEILNFKSTLAFHKVYFIYNRNKINCEVWRRLCYLPSKLEYILLMNTRFECQLLLQTGVVFLTWGLEDCFSHHKIPPTLQTVGKIRRLHTKHTANRQQKPAAILKILLLFKSHTEKVEPKNLTKKFH